MGIPDLVGVAGAVLIVVAYFLLQTGRLDALSVAFPAVNALGASGILVSLAYEFNLSAFAVELFWLAISLYGIYRAVLLRRQSARPAAGNRHR